MRILICCGISEKNQKVLLIRELGFGSDERGYFLYFVTAEDGCTGYVYGVCKLFYDDIVRKLLICGYCDLFKFGCVEWE